MEDRKQQSSSSPRPSSDTRTPFTSSSASDFHLAASSADPIAFDPSLDFASSHALFSDQSFAAVVDPVAVGIDQPSFTGLGFNTSSGLNDTSFDAPLFSSVGDEQNYTDASVLDPALLGTQVPQQAMSAATAMNHMATLAPILHPFDSSPHGSPALNHSPFQPPHVSHSRNSSLDPSSAAFPPLSAEWGAAAFQGHRRTLSDAHSDVSSTHQSPYLQATDNFDQSLERQPMSSQDPAMFQDVLAIGQVSLSEGPTAYMTPSHSPRISPQLLPVQHSPQAYPPLENYHILPSMPQPMGNQYNENSMYSNAPFPNMEPYATPVNHAVLKSEHPPQSEIMTPPEINIQLAPPSRQASFEPQGKDAVDAQGLTPPERARGRSSSDPSGGRQSTPSRKTLSPQAAGVGSRSPSPSVRNRRSSTSAVPNRDYILDLADPMRPTSNQSDGGDGRSASGSVSGGSGKKQKHPATFQCSLCPKRFTRAYNLRSHLRTHTDERPFVCGHCGKAFARQHDRKRHEGLHSGEKKFVCRGQLKNSASWGCGRRFARADALGRHFRSEAGRMCIKPLMDEEALEHSSMVEAGGPGPDGVAIMAGGVGMPGQPGMMMMAHDQRFGGYPPQQGYAMTPPPGVPMRLPQALLQQYPTLSNIWDQLPANGGPDDVDGGAGGDMNSRASFSSAGEFDDDELDMGGGPQGGAFGWASDVGP